MSVADIIGVVFGGITLISLIVLCFIGICSAEKTENYKRELYKESTKYLKERNKMFDREEE